MKKVLVFGTFDYLHKGHQFFLSQAKKYGDQLYVVVALDETVRQLKGNLPQHSQEERLKMLQGRGEVYRAVLGNLGDKYKVIEDIHPDVICLGYDQRSFIDQLPQILRDRSIDAKIVTLAAHHPEKYKTSLLRRK